MRHLKFQIIDGNDQVSYEDWFEFEGKVFRQSSVDGVEWEEPELTPYPIIPFAVLPLGLVEPWK